MRSLSAAIAVPLALLLTVSASAASFSVETSTSVHTSTNGNGESHCEMRVNVNGEERHYSGSGDCDVNAAANVTSDDERTRVELRMNDETKTMEFRHDIDRTGEVRGTGELHVRSATNGARIADILARRVARLERRKAWKLRIAERRQLRMERLERLGILWER